MFIDSESLKRYLENPTEWRGSVCVDEPVPLAIVMPSKPIIRFLDFIDQESKWTVLTSESLPTVRQEFLFLVIDFWKVPRPDRSFSFAFYAPECSAWLRFLSESKRLGITNGPDLSYGVISVDLADPEFSATVDRWLVRNQVA